MLNKPMLWTLIILIVPYNIKYNNIYTRAVPLLLQSSKIPYIYYPQISIFLYIRSLRVSG